MNLDQKRELADAAKEFLDSHVFKRATDELAKDYLAELMSKPAGDLTVPMVHARMLALEDIRSKLTAFIVDAQFAERNPKAK